CLILLARKNLQFAFIAVGAYEVMKVLFEIVTLAILFYITLKPFPYSPLYTRFLSAKISCLFPLNYLPMSPSC
ncbi:MAG: hypothetical protein WC589_22105, partial [Sphingobacterium sp.]